MAHSKNILIVAPHWASAWSDALREAHDGDRIAAIAASPRDLERELPDAASGLGEIHEVYFLGATPLTPFDPSDDAGREEHLDAGVFALLALLRGLHAAGARAFSLKVVTVDGHVSTPADVPHPCAAAVYGLLRVYVREFRRARVYCEDRTADDFRRQGNDPREWARALAARTVEAGLEETAIRNDRRMHRALEQVHLDPEAPPPFRAECTYLVLGGAGGIGLELSKWLAREFRANLVWVGRSPLDAAKERGLREVEALGGRVLYVAADASDEKALREGVEKAKGMFGPIHGAFHSALVLEDRPLTALDEASMRKVLAPKVEGSLSLWRALAGEPLEFLVFFSSSQFMAANPGQANYAAGSAFLDAFATWLARHSAFPVRTINWGYWGSVGAVASEQYRARFEALGVHSIEPEQGMIAVKRVLSNPLTQVLAFNGTEDMFKQHRLLTDAECKVFPPRGPSATRVLDAPFPCLDFDRPTYAELDDVVCQLVLFGLQGLGVLQKPGASVRGSCTSHRVLPKYEPLWREFLRMLRDSGYLQSDGLTATPRVRPMDQKDLEGRARALAAGAPELRAVLELVVRCAADLGRVLTGEKAATEVVFPRSSVELVEGIYKNNSISDYYNELVIEAVRRCIQHHLADTKNTSRFRILEVGAGTGGTSEGLLAALAPFGSRLEYVYTDVSRAFLIHGKKHYGHHRFTRFELFDVSKDPVAQGFDAGSFDLVVATNVLHATPRMDVTLGNLKSILRGGGWLVVNEATALRGFSTLIFGLLDGWWNFQDGHQRIQGSPLLSVDHWDSALRREGFRSVRALGEASDGLAGEQHVIVSESDGIVRVGKEQAKVEAPPLPVAPAARETVVSSAPARETVAVVTAAVSRVLELEASSIDPTETFADLGVDSVLAVEIASQLSEELRVELRSTDLFNYTSIRDLAAHLAPATPVPQPAPRREATDEAIAQRITAILATVLELDAAEIGPEDGLADLGVDSVLAGEIAAQLEDALGVDVRITDLFSYGSVSQLAAHLSTTVAPSEHAAPSPVSAPAPSAMSDFPDLEAFARNTESAPALPAPALPISPALTAGESRIAIIGMSGRFPGANGVDAFWSLLRDGKSGVREAPERWDIDAFYDGNASAAPPGFKCRAGFLDDVLRFDTLFFGISPKEAELMDPQQRLVTEEGFRALEDAGYPRALLKKRKCGAYVGSGNIDYMGLLRQLGIVDDPSLLTGNVSSILAARLSYILDLAGPALSVDTACSSSLVAIHLACEALRNRTVEMALAGGVAVLNTPGFALLAHRSGMLSADGTCKTFDARANGMVPAEGVGMLVLKRLDDALRDGDHVHGVILGSGVNQDGRTNGITAPSAVAQAALESEVYESYGIEPDGIDYIECHGTGTKLGDPIEVQALSDAFRKFTNRRGFCALGSVKTNIGHALSAAGVAGVMKVLLGLRHGQLAPSLHFEKANEHIDFESSPFFVQSKLAPWPRHHDRPRRAAVSSFGFSGTNAHLVLEEAPERPAPRASEGPYLFALSARSHTALAQRVRDLATWLRTNDTANAARVAYTTLCRRTHHTVRWAVVAHDLADLQSALASWHEPGATRRGIVRETAENGESSTALDAELGGYILADLVRGGRAAGERAKKLEALAELFTKGAPLEWESLFADRTTVSLPAYPFEGDRHLPAARVTVSKAKEASAPGRMLLAKTWVRDALPHPSAPPAGESARGRWVVLVDGAGGVAGETLRAAAKARFTEAAWEVIDVSSLDHAGVTHAAAVGRAAHGGQPASGLIDLADLWPAERGTLERTEERLALMQALVLGWLDGRDASTLHYLHVTSGTSGPEGREPSLRGAFFAGLPGVLSAEHRSVRARTIDIDSPAGELDALLGIVERELSHEDDHVECAWREGVRYVPSLTETASSASTHEPLGDGYWVITGASGGIGARMAQELAARGVRKLALMVRRPLQPKSSHAIRELEEGGVSVRVYQGPLDERDDLSRFFTECQKEWGTMEAVLHCAGAFVSGQHAFARRDLADVERVLEPKVAGVGSLFDAITPFAPRRLVFFSSIASLCPTLAAGIGDYALANGFMNRFADFAQRAGLPMRIQSIAWSNWDGIGFGNVDSPSFRDLGLVRHSPEQGWDMLMDALRSESPVLLAGARDPARFRSDALLRARRNATTSSEVRQRPPTFDAARATIPSAHPPAIVAEASAADGTAQERAVAWLRRIFAEELHLSQSSLHASTAFQDFGVDSILMVELMKRAEADLGDTIEPAVFLEHPTLARLAAHLCVQYPRFFEAKREPAKTLLEEKSLLPSEESHRPNEKSRRPEPRSENARAIAVIGIGCHFPGGHGKEAFWEMLSAGASGIREIPSGRWNAANLYAPTPHPPGHSYSKWGGFIDGIEDFDPGYFGLNEELAPQIDPLIRQLLEVSVECVADAGYSPKELAQKNVGVFVGSRVGNYGRRIALPSRDTAVAVGQNFIAAHVSHFLDLHGPAIVVDTACSSSLVSLHLACQSLRSGECELAIAGGVDLLLDEQPYLTLSQAKALSPDGRCFTFDVRANGFVPGEGAGVLLLKSLERAIDDGDQIFAVIEGSAINNDGRTMGITTPNPEAQAGVVRAALADARVEAGSVSYLEAHGTGTMIGDPIELKALTKVFRETTDEKQFCALGSVKSNIGHLMSAAGVASVIKTVLCIAHGQLVPTLNCETPNPRFTFTESPFFVGTQGGAWPLRHGTRRAGISSFGFGGTNAHLIIGQLTGDHAEAYDAVREALPPVRFERRRHWLEAAATLAPAPAASVPAASVPAASMPAASVPAPAPSYVPPPAPSRPRELPGLLELTRRRSDSSEPRITASNGNERSLGTAVGGE